MERQTWFVKLIHLPQQTASSLCDAHIRDLAERPTYLRQSITWDQGTEMSRHQDLTVALGTKVYFADTHSPWQRGSNENTNGLLRQYFAKGTGLSVHTPTELHTVANELNDRPEPSSDTAHPPHLHRAATSPDHPVLR